MQPYLGTKQKNPYKEQLEKYLSSTQAKERRKFNEFVQSIDAFGPEICLNLRMVNIYRYRQDSIFLYCDLLKSIVLKHRWMNRFKMKQNAATINDEKEDSDDDGQAKEPDLDKDSPIRHYILSLLGDTNEAFQSSPEDYQLVLRMHVRRAPFFFNLINQVLRDSYFSRSLEQLILDYSKIFMAQPLPNSLLPLETNRILLNERILPGITKILQIQKDFPQLNLNWDSKETKDHRLMNIYNQASHVFVYEDGSDVPKYRENNGTLNLIYSLDERMTPDSAVMHAIRKNFLRKVLISYLSRIPVSREGQHAVMDNYVDTEFSIGTISERLKMKQAILRGTEWMDPNLVFNLFEKLVFELKQDLSKNNLVPDLIQTENNVKEGAAYRDNIQKQAYLAEIIRKLINFVYSGNFLGAYGL